jgi:hypothetical protein
VRKLKSRLKSENKSLYDNGKGSPRTTGMRYKDSESAIESIKKLKLVPSSKTYKM